MADLQLDWSSAEVSQGKLSVSLDGEPTKEWRASFGRTVQLLDHGMWADIELSKRTITVAAVEPGSEEKLRFFLDSVVQEANGEQPDENDDGERDEAEPEADDDPDREMTDRFRASAPERPADSSES
jgi:hypothetical protein